MLTITTIESFLNIITFVQVVHNIQHTTLIILGHAVTV